MTTQEETKHMGYPQTAAELPTEEEVTQEEKLNFTNYIESNNVVGDIVKVLVGIYENNNEEGEDSAKHIQKWNELDEGKDHFQKYIGEKLQL